MRLSDLAHGRLTWRELWSYLAHLPRGSALARVELGDDAEWGLAEQLIASCADALHGANWQRSGKGKPPRPIERPGVKKRGQRKVHKGTPIRSQEEIKEWVRSMGAQGEEVATAK